MASSTLEPPTIGIPVRFQRDEFARHGGLSDAGVEALRRARGPEDLLAGLVRAGSERDLLRTLAFLLPKRQSVWWSCLAARLAPSAAKGEAAAAALTAAEAWVQVGSEEMREAAGAAAEACDHAGVAAWAAMGAFWSGGSLAPADQGIVPPASHLTGAAVRSAVLIAAASEGGPTLAALAAIGLEMLAGGSGRTAFDRARGKA